LEKADTVDIILLLGHGSVPGGKGGGVGVGGRGGKYGVGGKCAVEGAGFSVFFTCYF